MFPSDVPDQEYEVQIGSTVVTADGHPLGTVGAVSPEAVTVEQGPLLTEEVSVPWGLITSRGKGGDGTVYLNVPVSQVVPNTPEEG